MASIRNLLPAHKRSASTGFCGPCAALALIAGTDASVGTEASGSADTSSRPSMLTAIGVIGAVGLGAFLVYGAMHPPKGPEHDREGYLRSQGATPVSERVRHKHRLGHTLTPEEMRYVTGKAYEAYRARPAQPYR